MIESTYVNNRTSISSVLGKEFTEPATDEEEELANGGIAQDVEQMFEDLDDVNEESMEDDASYEGSTYPSDDDEFNSGSSQATFSPFCDEVIRKKELPTPLFAGKNERLRVQLYLFLLLVFADARQREEDPIRRYFTDSRLYKVWSLMTLPVTLPMDLTYAATKR